MPGPEVSGNEVTSFTADPCPARNCVCSVGAPPEPSPLRTRTITANDERDHDEAQHDAGDGAAGVRSELELGAGRGSMTTVSPLGSVAYTDC